MLDAEHVVHEHGAGDIEPDVSPADTEVAPALTIDCEEYSNQPFGSSMKLNPGSAQVGNELTDIASSQILVRLGQWTVLAVTRCAVVIEPTTSGSEIPTQVFTAG